MADNRNFLKELSELLKNKKIDEALNQVASFRKALVSLSKNKLDQIQKDILSKSKEPEEVVPESVAEVTEVVQEEVVVEQVPETVVEKVEEIKEEPKISTTVNCYYTYIDAEESYSDMIYQDVLLEKDGKNNKYKGKTVIDIGRTDIESYSCSYRVLDTSGKYIEFSK